MVLSVSDCKPKAVIVAFVAAGEVVFDAAGLGVGVGVGVGVGFGLLGVTVTVSFIFNT